MARRAPRQIIAVGNETWMVRMYIGRHSQTGKRVYENLTIHGSIRKAQAYLHNKLVERDRGRETDGAKLTLNQYLDRWLDTAKMRLREKTFEDYQYLLNRYVPSGACWRGSIFARRRPARPAAGSRSFLQILRVRTIRPRQLRPAPRPARRRLQLLAQPLEWHLEVEGKPRSP